MSVESNTTGVMTFPIAFTNSVYALARSSHDTTMYTAEVGAAINQKDAARRWSYTSVSTTGIDLIYGSVVKTNKGHLVVFGY